ncbi:MAG: trigger factor [Wenzhouxiangellaceae bacterium]|nr:trigger factor [Wenzhouxiangellaceae bacterium]
MEKTGDLGRRLTVELPAEQIDGKISGRLNELRGQVRLKGFRPGKVPMNVVRQRYGAQVRDEVQQEIMQSSLQEAVREQNLRIAGVSSLRPDSGGSDGEFRFVAELEVFPELPDIDVADLKIERPVVEITGQDVDDMIETLREQRRSWSDVARGAAEGDRVSIEFYAELDGKRVPETGEQKAQPVLGSGSLFESFEQALTGLEAGAAETVELTFPEDFSDSTLAGNAAQVSLVVSKVEASEVPVADDEFAHSFGIDEGIEKMRQDVRRNLERELRAARSNRLKKAVTDGLAERYSDFSLPDSAVRQELEQMRAQVRQQYGEQVDLPDEQLRPGAERRVRLGFLLAEIARQHELDIDPKKVQERIAEIAETYENPAEVVELYHKNPQLAGQIENSVLEEQVVDWVLENAQVEDQEMSFKKLMEAV